MLRKCAEVVAVLMVCLPAGEGVHLATASYIDQIHSLRPVARWSPGPIEMVLLCCCLLVLCLIAPRFRVGRARCRRAAESLQPADSLSVKGRRPE